MSAVEIKICGITRVQDALLAIEAGAAMLGVNFYAGSPRCITLERAQEIAEAMDGRIGSVKLVGVFVNMNVSEVMKLAHAVPLDAVQLHGDESLADCKAVAEQFEVIRALKVDAEFSAERAAEFACCRGLLLDAPSPGHGGAGECFDWTRVQWKKLREAASFAKIFLAGGLHADNVSEAISIARPDAVDVCSGVESAKGIKSMTRMRDFVAAVRAVERQER